MSESGSVERELKFICEDLEGLRERLRELEAERVSAAGDEDNRVYDRNGEILAGGCVLRMRNDRQGTRLTFKGPATFEGEVKVRPEHETLVDDANQMHRILESLGYSIAKRYQKKREEWQLGSVTVSLDHTPIGDFAEFEGESAERVAKRCGFEVTKAEKRNYLELYDDYQREHPEAPKNMIFE